jgi:CheY-like chemotaxis protein
MAELLQNREEVNDFLSPQRDRTVHFAKFNSYADFVNSYLSEHLFFDPQQYFYGQIVRIRGLSIGLLGLNTAWMSATHRSLDGTVLDQGHLLIGERQLDAALRQISKADLSISLMHHPLYWLHPSDRSRIKRRLSAKCKFVLHGHLHEPEVEIRQAISGSSSMFIPAGALYYNRDFPNSYNLVRFDTSTQRGNVYLRRYADSGPQGSPIWVKDLDSTGNDLDGQFPFNILDGTPVTPVNDLISNAKRVLCVEDKEGWRQVISSILFPPDFDLQFASSAAEARQRLNEDFDLLILNLCLTGDRDYEGEVLLSSLCQNQEPCDITCIVLTGYSYPTSGLFDRYDVFEVFVKGNQHKFDKYSFLSTVRDAVGL